MLFFSNLFTLGRTPGFLISVFSVLLFWIIFNFANFEFNYLLDVGCLVISFFNGYLTGIEGLLNFFVIVGLSFLTSFYSGVFDLYMLIIGVYFSSSIAYLLSLILITDN